MLAPTRLENACAKCKRMWGSSSSQTDRQYWAVDSITAVPVSLPAHSHPRQRPSRLSCVCQSPQPSSLPPGVEAAERTRKRLHTVTCYHPRPGRSGATQIGSKRAFPIKLKNGLTSSRVQTDLRRPRSISVHAQLNPIFMAIGGPQAHENSKPSGGSKKPLWWLCQNPFILQCRNGGFCAFRKDLVLESGPQLPHSQQSTEFMATKGNSSKKQDSVPAHSKKRPIVSYRRCLNRLFEGFLFAGAQSLVSLTWPRSMQRSRVPQCHLLTRAIHRGGP